MSSRDPAWRWVAPVIAGAHLAGWASVLANTAAWGPTLKGDEYSHWPQIQMFLAGTWAMESSVTQIPGFHLLVAAPMRALGLEHLDAARSIALLLGAVSIVAFAGCVRALDVPRPALRTLQFALLPLLFPFRFLLYTDTVSVAVLLLMAWAVLRERLWLAGFLGLAALGVRQANAPFVFAAPLLLYARSGAAPSPKELVVRSWSFGLAGVAFLAFLVVNGGVAVGAEEQDKHPLGVYVGNVAFALIAAPAVALPWILPGAWRGLLATVHARAWGRGLAGLAAAVAFVALYEIESGMNHATGNYLHNHLVTEVAGSLGLRIAGVLLAALTVLTLLTVQVRGRGAVVLWVVILGSLVPLSMVEPRYWVPAWTLVWLVRPDAGWRVERGLAAWFAVGSAVLFGGLVLERFFP